MRERAALLKVTRRPSAVDSTASDWSRRTLLRAWARLAQRWNSMPRLVLAAGVRGLPPGGLALVQVVRVRASQWRRPGYRVRAAWPELECLVPKHDWVLG